MQARESPARRDPLQEVIKNVEVGLYISSDRANRGASWIHRNRFGRGGHRQVPVFHVPGHMPDFLGHRHIRREEGDVTNFQIRRFSNAV